MRTVPGGSYLVELRLQNAERLGHSWLVGALSARYPMAEIVSVETYDGVNASLLLRWRRSFGEIREGDMITPALEGVAVPYQAMPRGAVEKVSQVGDVAHDLESCVSSELKVAMSGGILLLTWYLVEMIKRTT